MLNKYEAARRVVEYLETLPRFRDLIEEVNQAGNIDVFTDAIATAIRVQELE